MKVLELGSYVVPAYAGMILAEQGHQVTKWTSPATPDPIEGLRRGGELWAWINHGKHVEPREARSVAEIEPGDVDAVVDNIRVATWGRWGVDPAEQAARLGVRWVSMRDEFDGRSFDVVAQARAWADHAGWIPFYLGDTTAGLWVAFKLLNLAPGEHAVLRQATCLAKLVEGEAVVPALRDGTATPWDDPGTYGFDPATRSARVQYRGEWMTEPARDEAWRLEHLPNQAGRFTV